MYLIHKKIYLPHNIGICFNFIFIITSRSIFVLAMWTVRISKRNVPCLLGRTITTTCILRQGSHAEYPPIVDVKPEPTMLRQELALHEKIRNLDTVEEKAIGINMPRF